MPDLNTAFAVGLVDALARSGVRHACVSPGSRSTPLALAFADHGDITEWVHHDERSGAFFALGIAKTTGAPAVVLTTSGTAAAELFPAIVEARYGRVPLIAVTADRPAELRDVGAPQTIDQRALFGRMPLWSHDVDTGAVDPAPWVGSLAARLVAEATGVPRGPVHLNVAFREPLLPEDPATTPAPVHVPRLVDLDPSLEVGTVGSVAEACSGKRGLLVAGPQDSPSAVDAALAFAAAARWPIVADPLSGLRAGGHDTAAVVAHGDPLAWEGWLDLARPEVVLRFGAVPTSKALWRWLEDHPEVPQIFVEPAGWRDPTASATAVVRADPTALLATLAAAVESADGEWMERWEAADAAVGSAIDEALSGASFPNEPAVARMLAGALPDPSVVWVASSMPIRDVDAFFGTSGKRIRFLGNRGVNGVDGFVSSGLGSAAVSTDPVVLLAGDLSVLHDLNALATAAATGIDVTILVLNNNGGGIFHFLPQAGHPHFERLFGTPHGVRFAGVASAFGVATEEIADADDLAKALAESPSGPRLLEIRTDRAENLALHREIRAAVRKAIEAL